ncbi:hypothetical protein KSX_21680 [Ktedonospora formicarum]|uniref:Uncharacterized protein n=2 Tax=Ktedonospora formicarum TaxID=2778364 RepID=A0A8J3MQI4_9CHLR|nr:hypothetical protein KSX_21680 [Ktedonospora formicarum]
MHSNKQFEPNNIEEELDQIAHLETSSPLIPEARLVRDLEHLSHQYIESYQRVGDRLSLYMKNQATLPNTTEKQANSSPNNGYIRTISPNEFRQTGSFQPSPSTTLTPSTTSVLPIQTQSTKRKQIHTTRLFATIAAILIISLLSSTLWFFYTARLSQAPANKRNHITQNTPTPAPLPASFQCPKIDEGFSIDEGFYYVCTQKQYKLINQTHHLSDGQKVTLLLAHADISRVSLEIAVSSSHPYANEEVPSVTLDLTTKDGSQICREGYSGYFSSDRKTYITFDSCPYFTSARIGTSLDLHLKVELGDMPSQGPSTEFDFALPVHPARIVNTQQTITINDDPYILHHVIVAPSMTRIFLMNNQINTQFNALDYQTQHNAITLQIGEQTYYVTSQSWTPVGKAGGVAGLEIDLDQPLYDKQGTWTLTIDKVVVPGATQNLVYNFTVPPAQ